MKGLVSPSPSVNLISVSAKPFALSIAAARTCYSSRGIISPKETAGDLAESEDQRIRLKEQAERIAQTTYKAGHHTVYQHAYFTFTLDRISRHFVWSFLHSHPYYNSEQVSQRYVEVKHGTALVPDLPPSARHTYEQTLDLQFGAYHKLIQMLLPMVEARYRNLFPARDLSLKRWQNDIHRKAQEIARYVLPVATFTYLYHTVSALTLFRYKRLCDVLDTPLETRLVVQDMVRRALDAEPEFATLMEDEIPLVDTPEFQYGKFLLHLGENAGDDHASIRIFRREFDSALGNRLSLLVGWKENNEALVADGIRQVFGVPKTALTDAEAIRLALDPACNNLLGESLNLTTMSKVARALSHAHYTFQKKLSHTADSQEQRHRTLPASRPSLFFHLSEEPDYVIPALIKEDESGLRFYEQTMMRIWDGLRQVWRETGDREAAQYLLPNAVAVRFLESGDLSNFWHKWVLRLCFNAQEEIYQSARDEVLQVQKVNPEIGKYLGAPCTIRLKGSKTPYCPEGARYCGVPVWNQTVEQYTRIL
ncbi:MAG: FAD-dependent thymidylate synthase [bacterium JZ-2024 1]